MSKDSFFLFTLQRYGHFTHPTIPKMCYFDTKKRYSVTYHVTEYPHSPVEYPLYSLNLQFFLSRIREFENYSSRPIRQISCRKRKFSNSLILDPKSCWTSSIFILSRIKEFENYSSRPIRQISCRKRKSSNSLILDPNPAGHLQLSIINYQFLPKYALKWLKILSLMLVDGFTLSPLASTSIAFFSSFESVSGIYTDILMISSPR